MGYSDNIGKKVQKAIKPFKSGLKINTIKGVGVHPTLGTPTYSFVEDDSEVECKRCILVDDQTFNLPPAPKDPAAPKGDWRAIYTAPGGEFEQWLASGVPF